MSSDILGNILKSVDDIRQRDPLKDIPQDYVAALHPDTYHAIYRHVIDNNLAPAIYSIDRVGGFLRRRPFVSLLMSRGEIQYMPYSLAVAKYGMHDFIGKRSFVEKIRDYFHSVWVWLRSVDFTADDWREQSSRMWHLAFLRPASFSSNPPVADHNAYLITSAFGIPKKYLEESKSSNRAALETLSFNPLYGLSKHIGFDKSTSPSLHGE